MTMYWPDSCVALQIVENSQVDLPSCAGPGWKVYRVTDDELEDYDRFRQTMRRVYEARSPEGPTLEGAS